MLLKLTGSIAVLGLALVTATAMPVHQTSTAANTSPAAAGQVSLSGDMSSLAGAFGKPAQPRLDRAPRLDSLPTGSGWGTGASLRPTLAATWSQVLIGR
jgi:hypothetical protein